MRARTLADILREVNVAPQMQDTLARIVKNLGGGRMPTVFAASSLANANNAVETAVVQTPPLNPGIDAAIVLVLFFWATNAVGASGTAVNMRIRQGVGIAGTIVNASTASTTVTAGNAFSGTMFAVDTPGAVAGQIYTGTVQVTAGAAASNTNAAAFLAMAIG